MSDLMRCIPLSDLLQRITEEAKQEGRVFGISTRKFYQNKGNQRIKLNFGQTLGSPVGPAAGPHTQLAQNIVAAYLAGARFIELKTVQTMDGEDLRHALAKPCINAADEGYNVEWSTELRVEEAMAEYIKAWFLCHILMKEYGLSETRDFAFNMSCGYNLEGIQSAKIDNFLNTMKDASGTEVFNDCKAEIEKWLPGFKHFTKADLDDVSPNICTSLALSTMHGCPANEIQGIVNYLLVEKQLTVFLKCNPTLLGYAEARRIVDELGFDYLAFDDSHFKSDLQFAEAVELLEGFLKTAADHGVRFGVKLTNTFPVLIKANELPGSEMYASGRALLPLSIHVAEKLAEIFGRELPMSYSGGADGLNIEAFINAGILPVTVCTTLLKPGGYERLRQIAENGRLAMEECYTGPDYQAIVDLRKAIMADERNRKDYREEIILRKTDSRLPLFNCFKAPCKDGGCPIHQDVPAYLNLIGEGKYQDAVEVILQDNALPNILGEICYHPCTKRCTRVDYDKTIDIRGMKKLATDHGFAEVLAKTVQPQPIGKTVLIIGAGVQGLACAYFLQRAGFSVTVAESKDKPFGILNTIRQQSGLSAEAMERDLAMILKLGVELKLSVSQDQLTAMTGFDYVLSSIGTNAGFEEAVIIKKDKVSRLQAVYAMAYAKDAALEIIRREKPDYEIMPARVDSSWERIYDNKAILIPPREGIAEAKRCLSCNTICEICAEVCPNRANVPIMIPFWGDLHQILHVDYMCNECGNCDTFCPHADAPYKAKFTLFGCLADFQESDNCGVYIASREQVYTRYEDGSVEETALSQISNSDFQLMAETILEHYAYLLVEFGGKP